MRHQLPVLITGATGFLGDRLSRVLQKSGYKVIATGRDKHRLQTLSTLGIRTIQKDLSESYTDQEIEDLGSIGSIVHCAALSSPWGPLQMFRDANTQATKHVLELARLHNDCRLIHISSPAVYFQPKDQRDLTEADPLPRNPINNYARTKIEAEQLLMRSDHPSIILRPRGIYGPGDSSLVPRLLRAAEQRPLPLFRGGRAETDLTHVDDVISAIVAALEAKDVSGTRTYNISGGEALNIKGVIETVCYYAGCDLRWRALPVGLVMAATRVIEKWSSLTNSKQEPLVTTYSLGLLAWSQTLDISKAERELGWTPSIPFEDGVQEALKAIFS